jgi:hypothetical protein
MPPGRPTGGRFAISSGFSSFFLKKLLYMGTVWFRLELKPYQGSSRNWVRFPASPPTRALLHTVVELAALHKSCTYAELAQLAEHSPCKREVKSSSLLFSSINIVSTYMSYAGVSPSGKAQDFGSCIVGSNPTAPAK